MGLSKQQLAAAKRLVDGGQKRDSRGEFVAKQREIIELLDSDFSDDESDSIDGDGDDWRSVSDEEEQQQEEQLSDESTTVESMNDEHTAELEKEVNEINLDQVFAARVTDLFAMSSAAPSQSSLQARMRTGIGVTLI
jgi:hypothetical protein